MSELRVIEGGANAQIRKNQTSLFDNAEDVPAADSKQPAASQFEARPLPLSEPFYESFSGDLRQHHVAILGTEPKSQQMGNLQQVDALQQVNNLQQAGTSQHYDAQKQSASLKQSDDVQQESCVEKSADANALTHAQDDYCSATFQSHRERPEISASDERWAWVEIDREAMRYNIKQIRKHIGPNVMILAVVKADGYGHGAEEAARIAISHGARYLGVASVAEGVELRILGITAPI
ncbi:MAG: alanine racemase, partial [Coriobacteriales bacterium]|nr:alanine racemase [Coriobacteriales bacterium]